MPSSIVSHSLITFDVGWICTIWGLGLFLDCAFTLHFEGRLIVRMHSHVVRGFLIDKFKL
jgi:hypothetical protein